VAMSQIRRNLNKFHQSINSVNANAGKTNITDIVAKYIARELLLLDEGSRIPTVDEYEERFGVSRGTVQKALAIVDDQKVVELRKRGVLGTFLYGKNLTRLWQLSGWINLTGAGALPSTKRQEALSSAIYVAFGNIQTSFNFAYLQGAYRRVQGMLADKYDFVVTSKGAAEYLIQEMPSKVRIALELEPYSFLSGYCIIKQKGFPNRMIRRVGIDPNSPDQAHLTRRLFSSPSIELVEMYYARMPTAVASGDIDACIFNQDAIDRGVLEYYSLDSLDIEDIPVNLDLSDLTRAVILINPKNYMIDKLVVKLINPNQVAEIQREVMNGKRLPIL